MAITQCEFDFKLKVTETIPLGLDAVTDQPFIEQIDTTNSSGTKTPTTSVPCTQRWADTVSLSGGTVTIDLTALSNGNLPTKDFTGLTVQFIKVRNPSTNANNITVADGAANGYLIFGDASGQVTIPPGMTVMFGAVATEGLAAVSATVKNITVTGTGSQAFDIQIVAG